MTTTLTPTPARRRTLRLAPRTLLGLVAVLLAWLGAGAAAYFPAAKLASVQENNSAAFLPQEAESTRALELQGRFQNSEVSPGILVYERPGGLTDTDRAAVAADLEEISRLAGVVAPPTPPFSSADGQALQVVVPLGTDFEALAGDVTEIRRIAGGTPGLSAYLTGPAGIGADFGEAFEGIDTTLLGATAAVVIVILLLVYRSPVLWALPLLAAGLSLLLAQAAVYLGARYGGLDVNGQSAGILTVLVFGAGTDYALLLISRYREELHNHPGRVEAMRVAWRGAAPAIVASGATVILGLLCLLVSSLSSNQSLGPVSAIGIACAMAVMLTFLPVLLMLLGRFLFWPFVPRFGTPSHEETGMWGRVARVVGRRPRASWLATALALVVLALGTTQLRAEGIPQTEAFTTDVESVTGQEVLARHFPAGAGSPAVVVGRADTGEALLAAVRATPGVADARFYADVPPGPPAPGSQTPAPKVVDGLVEVDATLADPADSAAAAATVQRLRSSVDAADPGALVGGFTAVDLDVQDASRRDRAVIIPLVLLVIFVVLALLLRALVAPLLLIATVVLSFAATLGVCAVVFNEVFGFTGADSSFPLFAFVFLVALGIDYNIFLMTRVREEAQRLGTRPGVLKGLAVTGGVITSAGVVLAATFAVLGVLPLVFLAQLGFAVAFGVLLDTLLVRSVLVPALAYDLGRWVWWPGRLAADAAPRPPAPRGAPG